MRTLLYRRRYRKCVVFIVVSLVLMYWFSLLLHTIMFGRTLRMPVEDHDQFMEKFTPVPNKKFTFETKTNGGVKQILYWTSFFGIRPKEYVKKQHNCNCHYKCQLTADQSQLENSDAVLFHLYDTWAENWVLNTKKTVPFPKYRNPNQVWVIANMEPLGNLWGNFDIFNGLFNWTMTYRLDSTLHLPYGYVHKLRSDETRPKQTVNYYRQKTKIAAVRISNCKDYARRYRLVKQVTKYLDVDLFGKCYGNLCGSNSEDPFEENCDDIMKEYRFYLAFENSFCSDYVTEKYWLALRRNQIPIVNWKHVNANLIIPNSYINVYDFSDIELFGQFIELVNTNETIYNSYFTWKHNYAETADCIACIVCRALYEKAGVAQVYKDFAGWIKNDFCEEANRVNIWWKNFDRAMFDHEN